MSSFGLQSLSSEMTNQNTGKDFILCLMITSIQTRNFKTGCLEFEFMQMLFANSNDKIIEALFRHKGACKLTLKKVSKKKKYFKTMGVGLALCLGLKKRKKSVGVQH